VCFLINVLTIKNTINEKKEKILNIVQLMQRILIIEVSDTTGFDSSNVVRHKKIANPSLNHTYNKT
jgi:hypothetical protein